MNLYEQLFVSFKLAVHAAAGPPGCRAASPRAAAPAHALVTAGAE